MEVKQHEVALKLTFKPCLKIGNLNYTTDKTVFDSNPEENSYIEAFHSILQRELIERFEHLRSQAAHRKLHSVV